MEAKYSVSEIYLDFSGVKHGSENNIIFFYYINLSDTHQNFQSMVIFTFFCQQIYSYSIHIYFINKNFFFKMFSLPDFHNSNASIICLNSYPITLSFLFSPSPLSSIYHLFIMFPSSLIFQNRQRIPHAIYSCQLLPPQ